MATKKHSTPARRFSPIHDFDGQVITPIRDEFGTMEYEMQIGGQLIGYAASPDQARTTLAEVAAEQARQLAATLADEAAERDAEPCTWCGGNEHAKSVMQPAWCIACVQAMLQGTGDSRRDLYRRPACPARDPEETDGPQEEGGEGGPNPDADRVPSSPLHYTFFRSPHTLRWVAEWDGCLLAEGWDKAETMARADRVVSEALAEVIAREHQDAPPLWWEAEPELFTFTTDPAEQTRILGWLTSWQAAEPAQAARWGSAPEVRHAA